MSTKQKLELNWIGKHKRPRLEPRILLEDKELSYGDADSENLLIHGDNLLALKALEQKYAGKVKCIFIDLLIILEVLLHITMMDLNTLYGFA